MATQAPWGEFFGGLGQSVLTTAVDYHVADTARDNNMMLSPDSGNPFRAYPERVAQPNTNDSNPSGQPLRFLIKSDGSVQPLAVGVGLLVLVILLRK